MQKNLDEVDKPTIKIR